MACVHMDVVHGLGGLQLIASRNCRSEKKNTKKNKIIIIPVTRSNVWQRDSVWDFEALHKHNSSSKNAIV